MLRNLVLLVFSVILVACAEVKEVKAHQLVERDGIKYERFSSEPFTGRVSWPQEFGAYKDGLKTGLWTRFYENGQLEWQLEYINGEENGLSKMYHESGKLSARVKMVDGEENGLLEIYYENGQLAVRGEYVNGKKNGIRERYSIDGELELREVWEDGELVSSTGEDD